MGKPKYLLVLSLAGILLAAPLICFAQAPTPVEDTYILGSELDRVAGVVTWYQDLPGDYDQNGEVNLADVSALVRHFGESTTQTWPVESIQSVLDGDHNREINLADITVIAINFGLAIDNFELFYNPVRVNDELVSGTGILNIAQVSSPVNPLDGRLKYEVPMDIGPSPFFYLVSAYQQELVGGEEFIYEVYPHPPRLHAPYAYAMEWDGDTQSLVWHYRLHGDGDHNGEVNIADLTPIAIHFGEAGPFEPGSVIWHIDYDGNGEVNMADIAILKLNFGATLDGFLFYTTSNPAELPEDYSYPVLAHISYQDIVGESGDYIWLRPYTGDPGNPVCVGAPSEIILVP